MNRQFFLIIVLTAQIALSFVACNKNAPITLKSIKNALEDAGEYKISEYYIPSDHDFPLSENTVGGFSFFAETENAAMFTSTSAIVMEFKDEVAADDYVKYIVSNRDFEAIFQNGAFLTIAFSQNGDMSIDEKLFLDNLISEKPLKEKSATSDGTVAMIVLLCFGALCSSVGYFGIRKNRRLKLYCTSQTTGTVIKVHRKKSGGSKSSVSYYPEFSYAVKGISYSERSAVGTPKPRFAEGQQITVFYDHRNPEDFYVLEDGLSSAVFYIFFVVGALMLISAMYMPNLYSN